MTTRLKPDGAHRHAALVRHPHPQFRRCPKLAAKVFEPAPEGSRTDARPLLSASHHQGEFADATGISNIHGNRVIQELRSEGLIILKGSTLKVPDWERLRQVGHFDPTYLHLEQEAA